MSAEEERAAVVAWLRNPSTVMRLGADYVARRKNGQPTVATQQNRGVAFVYLLEAANAIESGTHLSALDQEGGAK